MSLTRRRKTWRVDHMRLRSADAWRPLMRSQHELHAHAHTNVANITYAHITYINITFVIIVYINTDINYIDIAYTLTLS